MSELAYKRTNAYEKAGEAGVYKLKSIFAYAEAYRNFLDEAKTEREACAYVEAAAKETGLKRVVLSGGTFQNQVLMHRLPARLEACGLTVYHHRRVSCNDEGLSLGQLRIAAARGEMPLS